MKAAIREAIDSRAERVVQASGTKPMHDYERLRELGSRLLALASRARDEGRHEFANELGRLAADAHEQAFAMEKQTGRDDP